MNRIYISDASRFISLDTHTPYLKEISEKRLRKYNDIKRAENKALSLVATLLIKEGLSSYGIEEKNADYDDSLPYPALKGRDDIFFSVSHSYPYALCAFSDKKTGADIEKIKTFNSEIPKRFFSRDENLYIDSKEDKEKAFFSLWTLKESAAKLYGTPIKEALKKYEFTPESNFFIKDGVFYSLIEFNGFMIAVASQSGYFSSVNYITL